MSSAKPPPPRPKPPLPKSKPPPPPPREKEDSLLDLLPDPDPEEPKIEEKIALEPIPIPAPVPSEPDAPTLPLPAVLTPAKEKPAWLLPVAGGSAVLVALVGAVAIGKAACGSSASVATIASATAAVASSAPHVAPAAPIACGLGGERRTIAPKALAASGVEVSALGNEIAVGFAATPNDATLEILDPSNAATATRVLARSNDSIRRVLPLSRTAATLDVDRKKDPLHVRRTLVADPPIDVGASDDGFAWAGHKADDVVTLWPLQTSVPIEQVRGDVLPDGKGFAIAFRQGSVVYAGAFGGSPPAPLGPLVHVDGLGTTGGAPVIAASGERLMIAWSDRSQPTETWHLRTASFKIGDTDAQPHAFNVPPGGLGEQTMSPDLTALGGGRFLLLWTEGTTTHQVRGAVLDEGSVSSAFAVSPDGVDAGQGQAAVIEGDASQWKGVAAYLSSTSPGFYEAVAAPIKCGPK
ncbi:MAG TPA: hypothetical protein VH054_27350 [Polyangiaceae bacterium]|nr:hypothetical protein [Polyangiaceae bacterium]